MADEPTGEVAPPQDPPTPPTDTPEPDASVPRPTDSGQATGPEAEQRGDLAIALDRYEAANKTITEKEKEISDLKTAHQQALDQRDGALNDWRTENAKLRAMLAAHTAGRIHIDQEMRHVNMDGVSWDDDGKMVGEPAYRALGNAPSPSTQPSREERAVSDQAKLSGAGAANLGRHVVPGVDPKTNTV